MNALAYRAIALDGDGTLSTDGQMPPETGHALEQLRGVGCKVILATGETADEVKEFPHLELFDVILAEEGGLILWSQTEAMPLGPKPPVAFVAELARHDVKPLRVGQVIISTCETHETTLRETISRLELNYELHRNRQQIMALPDAIDKGSGLRVLMKRLGVPLDQVVGIGDAENDRALLAVCGLRVAVANAVPELKQHADFVTQAAQGSGVKELIERLLDGEFAGDHPAQKRVRPDPS